MQYSGVERLPSKGDTVFLTLKILHKKSFNSDSYDLRLILEKENEPWFYAFGDLDEHVDQVKTDDVIVKNSVFPFTHQIYLSKNEFSASEHLNNLALERYYKNVWSGIWSITDIIDNSKSQLASGIDCKTTSRNTIGDIYNMVEDDAFRASQNESDVN